MRVSFNLVLTCIFLVVVSAGIGFSKDTCGNSYKNSNGTIRYNNKSSSVEKKVECVWHIYYLNTTTNKTVENSSIFLVFDDIFLLPGDTVSISDENGKALDFFDPHTLSNVSGVFSVLTGKSNITVTLVTTDDTPKASPVRTFQMHYYSTGVCAHKMDKASSSYFTSPFYDHKTQKMPIECSFKFSVKGKDNYLLNLWFEKFLFNQGNIAIVGADPKPTTVIFYTASNFTDREFLAKDELELNLTISNNTEAPEMFVATYDSVNKVCSGSSLISTPSGSASFRSPDSEELRFLESQDGPGLSCHWLVETDNGNSLQINLNQISLTHAMDQLIILDGPNQSYPVLVDLTIQDRSYAPQLFSSGKYLWVMASSPSLNEEFSINIDVSQKTSGGYQRNQGSVNVTDQKTSTFLLEVDPGKQVKLDLDKATTKLNGGTIKIYKDHIRQQNPFVVMDSSNVVYQVVSPTEKMAIVTESFGSSSLNGSFSGIDEGCFKYGTRSGDTFSVAGHCNSTCAWTVEPNVSSTDLLSFHFQTMWLTETDNVLIRQLDKSQTLVANLSSQTRFPDLWLPAASGALVQVSRGNCSSSTSATVIQSSYQVTPVCGSSLSPSLGETVEVTSPGYPNHYPLGALCTWTIVKPNNSAFLHVSLSDLQLAQESHILEISRMQGQNVTAFFVSNSSVKELPGDWPVFSDVVIKFNTSTLSPQTSLPGFNLTVTAIATGAVMVNSSDKFSTPGFPKPVPGNTLSAWIVKLDPKTSDNENQIIEYTFENGTSSNIQGALKVYDGDSLRSGLVLNFTSKPLLSRTSELIFVYKADNNSAFSVKYSNFTCNETLMCVNGLCMHEDWHCNGVNDCGDYSDEANCEGYHPPIPPPTPSPTPSPEPEAKGVSTAALAVGILVALVIGAVLGVGAPTAIRKFKGRNQSGGYSSFSNTMT